MQQGSQARSVRSGRQGTGGPGILVAVLTVLLAAALAAESQAGPTDVSSLCEGAARDASALTGVPLAVLQAIALAETGRRLPGAGGTMRPWPWTVNHAGDGHWFDTQEQALAYATAARDQGISNIDLGCFQINHRWHSNAFASLQAMFDPAQNALYAARFLRSLYQKYGDWSQAAGAYHSTTPEYAARYRERFDALYAALEGQDMAVVLASAPAALRPNRFPLLRVGARGAGASLVPLAGGGQSLIARTP